MSYNCILLLQVHLASGVNLEARAEIALLSRNIVFRGSDREDWHDHIDACPDGFDTGQFIWICRNSNV